jgi:hypothetical protein
LFKFQSLAVISRIMDNNPAGPGEVEKDAKLYYNEKEHSQ